MMGNMAMEPIPPFERFYLAQRDEVLGYLRRLLGPRAEDAWQETFLRALRAGVRPDGANYFPVFPFPSFTNITDADALAIKAYLFSLPPVRQTQRASASSIAHSRHASRCA